MPFCVKYEMRMHQPNLPGTFGRTQVLVNLTQTWLSVSVDAAHFVLLAPAFWPPCNTLQTYYCWVTEHSITDTGGVHMPQECLG